MRISGLLTLPIFLLSTTVVQAAGFCWTETASEVRCTDILAAIPPNYCRNFSQAEGGFRFGSVRNSNLTTLNERQVALCDSVTGQFKYTCYAEEFCGSSSSLSPTGASVFALNAANAQAKCVDATPTHFLNHLKALPPACLLAPRAYLAP